MQAREQELLQVASTQTIAELHELLALQSQEIELLREENQQLRNQSSQPRYNQRPQTRGLTAAEQLQLAMMMSEAPPRMRRDTSFNDLSYEEMIQIGEQLGNVEVGLDAVQIAQIPMIRAMPGDVCQICQEEAEPRVHLKQLKKCKHRYHPDCIRQWLQRKKTCPVCLDDLSESS